MDRLTKFINRMLILDIILAIIIGFSFLVSGVIHFNEANKARDLALYANDLLLDEIESQVEELKANPEDNVLKHTDFLNIILDERRYNLMLMKVSIAESSAARDFALGAFVLAAVSCVGVFKEWFQRRHG